jgi:hypothetical protein
MLPFAAMWSLVIAFLALVLPAQSSTVPELDVVLARATEYVTRYEAELGNLIGAEEYVQNAAWKNPGARLAVISKKQQRRMTSDFLILQVGREWTGLRKVSRVDGSRIDEKTEKFEEVFDDTPQGNTKRLKNLTEESSRFNIGDVLRQINLPTFALSVMRKEEAPRFAFNKIDVDKIQGIETWAIKFRELTPPTMVVGDKQEFLFSHGTLWIEPETGKILKTEFEVANPHTKMPVKGRVVVTYSENKKLGMLVPNLMQEHYESENSTIDCRADYSNFRRFEVDVRFDLGPTKPPGL